MAGLFLSTVVIGVAAAGLSVGLLLAAPPHGATQRDLDARLANGDAQQRIAFERLATMYFQLNSSVVGTRTANQVALGTPVMGAISSGDFPPSWYAKRSAAGVVSLCTPVRQSSVGALLIAGATPESIACQ